MIIKKFRNVLFANFNKIQYNNSKYFDHGMCVYGMYVCWFLQICEGNRPDNRREKPSRLTESFLVFCDVKRSGNLRVEMKLPADPPNVI